MTELQLRLRTPVGLLVDRPVRSLVAEDLDGWFGIRPGRRDLIAVLPAGLMAYVDDQGESFVALAGGLMDLRGAECRVMAREALISRQLEQIGERVREHLRSRHRQADAHRDVLQDLAKEALRRLAAAHRP